MAKLRHEGKIVIVTGAAIGNGQAFAQLFASEGAQVIIADLDEAKETVASIDTIAGATKAISIPTDITNEKEVGKLIAKINKPNISNKDFSEAIDTSLKEIKVLEKQISVSPTTRAPRRPRSSPESKKDRRSLAAPR